MYMWATQMLPLNAIHWRVHWKDIRRRERRRMSSMNGKDSTCGKVTETKVSKNRVQYENWNLCLLGLCRFMQSLPPFSSFHH